MHCTKCPRLAAFLEENRQKFPDFFNAPVASFGDEDPSLLIVGLAPGLKGANQTGRPFTKDFAGHLLYGTLLKFGWATGKYEERADDSLCLIKSRITNAVKCVPPQNKVTGEEINTCNAYLASEISSFPHLKVILSLGVVSHKAVLKALHLKQKDYPFKHGHFVLIKEKNLYLIDSYHCSRYNTSTKVLTKEMFEDVFLKIKSVL
ncbi:MAG: uracil-DNA glycosylase [Alphaproteobacteria bacterium]|nr:uracil-DNA glycosylase [Alphaproteobacteria bacterium]